MHRILSHPDSTAQRRPRYVRRVAAAMAVAIGTGALTMGAIGLPGKPTLAANDAPVQQTQNMNRAMPASFADVVEKVSPAVVNIQVASRQTPSMTDAPGVPGNMREFFEHFFGQPPQGMPEGQGNGEGQVRMGAGSGFAIDADGHIVTNEHVIHDADEITVTFKDGTNAKARLIGKDDKTDLALLKIDVDKQVPYVEFGKSDDVRVGDWIVTVGNPFGLGHSVNVGIVSARGRTIGAGPYDDFIQIDAPINRGNSGGPAFDVQGNVIGVNAAIFSPNGGNVGIGFAIPSAIAEKVIADLKNNGVVERGWLGVNIQPVTDEIADSLGLDKAEGALVADVRPDSPAANAGMQAGDVVLSVGDKRIKELRELPRVIADIEPGAGRSVVVWRDGERHDLSVAIGRQPTEDEVANAEAPRGPVEADIGMALKSLDPTIAKQLGLEADAKGVVVVGVKPGSPAAQKGLRSGDVLTKAGGKEVTTPEEMTERMAEAKKAGKSSILTLVKRGGGQRFISLPVGAA